MKACEILRRLRKVYKPKNDDFVLWKNPLELLIATVLSAQCTDKRVNMVTENLFKKYKRACDYAEADLKELEKDIRSTGFYKSKARYLQGIGKILTEKYHGKVPQTRNELLAFPGVAKKTANLVMAKAFKKFIGVAVDTHVKRLAPRMDLTKHHDPDKIASDLEKLFEPEDWLDVNEFFILHGRALCKSKPLCNLCPLQKICSTGVAFLSKKVKV